MLAFLDSKVPRSIPAADALYDIVVVNKSRPIAVDVNKGNGNLKNMAVVAGSNRLFSRILAGPSLVGFSDTTETFVRIGHSLFVLIAAFVGGQLSLHLCANHSKETLELPSPETGFVTLSISLDQSLKSSFEAAFPNITRWVKETESVEIGHDPQTGSFIEAIDEIGT